jgi:hypothetical protein
MRKVILAGLWLFLLPPLVGCTTIASMAVKHVAMSEGMKVAKSAYHGLKGDSADQKDKPASPREQAVVIASTPPGARIEVNGRRIGRAPVTFRMQLVPDGTVARDYRVRAVPTQPDQNPQERRFLHYSGEPGDRAPMRIALDMTAAPGRGAEVSYE